MDEENATEENLSTSMVGIPKLCSMTLWPLSWQQVLPFIHTHPKIQQLGIKLVVVVMVGSWVGRDENGAAEREHQTVLSSPGAKDCLLCHQFWQVKVWHQGNLPHI